jgi:hypothetical protein
LAPTSGKFPTNYTRLAEDLIPAAAFVAKALTGSGLRAYLFILERASGGKECAQLEERQQGIYLLCAIQPPPQQPQEAKQIRDLQAGAE